MIKEIPEVAKQVIKTFQEINIGGKNIVCPYYINISHKKDLRVMVGKGTPDEIVMESKIWEKIKGVDFTQMSADEIKQFLIDRGIGIDCSGFIIHVLNAWHKSIYKKPIWSKLKIKRSGIRAGLAYMLRPVEQLGAEVITDEINSKIIELRDVQPGDLIRSKAGRQNSHHIMLITKVEYDESNNPTMIEYTHSSPFFGKDNGIRLGQIKITDLNKPLQDQDWLEQDQNGVKFTYQGFLMQLEDNGLRRLKAFS